MDNSMRVAIPLRRRRLYFVGIAITIDVIVLGLATSMEWHMQGEISRDKRSDRTSSITKIEPSTCSSMAASGAMNNTVVLCESILITQTLRVDCPVRPLHIVFSVMDDLSTKCIRGNFVKSVMNGYQAFRTLNPPGMKMAVVVGVGQPHKPYVNPRTSVPMTDDFDRVRGEIAGLMGGRDQRYCQDPPLLQESTRQLQKSAGIDQPVDVLMHYSTSQDWIAGPANGCPNYIPMSLSAASQAKSSDTFVVASCHDALEAGCWGRAPDLSPPCSESAFSKMATSRAFYVENGMKIGSLAAYQAIAQNILRSARAADVTTVAITTALSADVTLVQSSVNPPPTAFDPASGVITWTLPITASVPLTLTYSVKPLRLGTFAVFKGSGAHLIDSQKAELLASWTSPLITVTHTCETPTPEVTPTGTPIPTPISTPSFTPAPTATAAPSATATPPPAPVYLPVSLRERCIPEREPVDVVIAVDTSSSMEERTTNGVRKLDAATAAASTFLGLLHLDTGDQAAIVAFNAQARVEQPLTADRVSLDATLAGLVTSPNTCLPCAVEVGAAELETHGRPGTMPVLVLLTDGRSNPRPVSEAVDRAAVAKAAGVTIFTIALGTDVDAAALQTMASFPSAYVAVTDAGALEAAYATVARTLPCPPGAFWGRR